MTEEFALQQVSGKAAQFCATRGLWRRLPSRWTAFGEHVLARSRLPKQQHGDRGRGRPAGQGRARLEGGAFADDPRIRGPAALAFRRVFSRLSAALRLLRLPDEFPFFLEQPGIGDGDRGMCGKEPTTRSNAFG